MDEIAAALNETVQLARLDGTENVYLAKVDSTHPLRLQSEVGVRLSAHATGLGKALLACLPDEEVRRRFGTKPLARMTRNTITSIGALVKELARDQVLRFCDRQRGIHAGPLLPGSADLRSHWPSGCRNQHFHTHHATLARDPDGGSVPTLQGEYRNNETSWRPALRTSAPSFAGEVRRKAGPH